MPRPPANQDAAMIRMALASLERALPRKPPADKAPPVALSFRQVLESPDYCGLTLSPVIAAIADASDGHPVDLDDDTSRAVFGCPSEALPTEPRRRVGVRAGGRGGKSSRLLAPKALHAAWTVPLPNLLRGERARALLIAPDKDLAQQDLDYVKGYIEGSPVWSKAVVRNTMECVTLERPDGKLVDIRTGAATRGGKAARGRSLAFVGMDEACFFYADDGYTVTDRAIYDAAIQRIVPGGQIWIASTPWVEGLGVLERLVERNHGHHEQALVALGATRLLNPSWDPTGDIEREMREEDPDNAAREIDAVPFAAGTKVFFPPDAIEKSVDKTREKILEPVSGLVHYGGADLGFRKNSSALAIARAEEHRARLAYYEELRPLRGQSLKPSEICSGFATKALEYGVRRVRGDLHYVDTAREEFAKHVGPHGQRVFYEEWNPSAEEQEAVFTELRRRMQEGLIDLPNDPRLLLQLRQTLSRPGPGGTVKVLLPKQGQAHGDLLMAVALAITQVVLQPRTAQGVRVAGAREMTTKQGSREERRNEEAMRRRLGIGGGGGF